MPPFAIPAQVHDEDRHSVPSRPLIMGIVNVTPDSFSDGGLHFDAQAAIDFGRQLVDEGADILDVGGESTRPGSHRVAPGEQWERIGAVVRALAGGGVPISVDTRSAVVARRAIDAGAVIINDVSAGRDDAALLPLVAEKGVDVILMHMQGSPDSMQQRPAYDDCVADVRAFLLERAEHAEQAGVARERIWIDPGIGFGKTVQHNLDLLGGLSELTDTGYRVVLGTSRKSFIDKLYNAAVDYRIGGSLASLAPAWRGRVHAVRVHDVRATFQFLELLARLRQA